MIHNYHSCFVSPHFDWLQSATDLTDLPGFQSHNSLPRYYLMVQDLLLLLKSSLLTDHASLADFRRTLQNLSDEVQQQQQTKSNRFVDSAIEAIEKHFIRWATKKLLPAGLLAEDALATVIACVMTSNPLPATLLAELDSEVHGRTFNLQSFHNFLQERVTRIDDNTPYGPLVLGAANLLIGGFDLRDKESPDPLKYQLYTNYLPLASHTQFVEAGVKEAKLVSCTDRSAALRSAYAVNRSARVHNDMLSKLTAPQRVEWLLRTTNNHVTQHDSIWADDEADYTNNVEEIAKLLRSQHYQQERLQKVTDDALDKLHNIKRDNVLQQKTGVDRTHTMEGLIPYGKLVKALYFDAIKVELLFRGCTEDEVNALKIKERKDKLKLLEIDRINSNSNNAKEKEAANKAFKPLSDALFPVK
jgi:hypothetical protein